jgi:hypothetical protein
MRTIILGLTILGALTVGPGARAALVYQPMIQQVDSNDCGPRCQQQRREVRQRAERERHGRMEEHRENQR